MVFDKKAPEWKGIGAEPPQELKREGFKAGYKPPAAYFNWFFNRITEAVRELQEKLAGELKDLAFKDTVRDSEITDMAAEKVVQNAAHRFVTDEEKQSWNGKMDSEGGDLSDMVIKTLEEPAIQFPAPGAGETSKAFFGKVRKFINDFRGWYTGVCLIGQIVNNCVTNRADLPLSAAQGKTLMDLYHTLNNGVAGKNPRINVLEYTNSIVVSPQTWNTVFNQSLAAGLYMIKQSLRVPNGCSGVSLAMECAGTHEQQTDRGNSPGVRGVIGTNIYYLPYGGNYLGSVYVNHTTTATVDSNLKVLKIW